MSATSTAGPSEASRDLLAALADSGPARQRAWSLLVARYSPRMYAVARSFRLDQATAEDLVQTAWLRLLERSQQLRDPDAVGAWLCTIVRNEALRGLSRRREVASSQVLEDRPDPEGQVDVGLLRAERALVLRRAYAHLSEDCQQLLRLLLADPPLSYDEVAAALGRPRGSLGPTRRRCLQALRARLPEGFEP